MIFFPVRKIFSLYIDIRIHNVYIKYIQYIKEAKLNLIISNSSGQPIYEQIASQIKDKIISGELKEEDPLPSMRMLAKELRISVITTKRAYEELEREGFIISLTGKGSFVAGKNLDFIREEHLRKIDQKMQEIIDLSTGCNLTLEDLQEMLEIIYKGE